MSATPDLSRLLLVSFECPQVIRVQVYTGTARDFESTGNPLEVQSVELAEELESDRAR
ncbi:MAG: hypothetical protein RL347_632 [Actinomycetota bacterium]|jgi:hypothetical protein